MHASQSSWWWSTTDGGSGGPQPGARAHGRSVKRAQDDEDNPVTMSCAVYGVTRQAILGAELTSWTAVGRYLFFDEALSGSGEGSRSGYYSVSRLKSMLERGRASGSATNSPLLCALAQWGSRAGNGQPCGDMAAFFPFRSLPIARTSQIGESAVAVYEEPVVCTSTCSSLRRRIVKTAADCPFRPPPSSEPKYCEWETIRTDTRDPRRIWEPGSPELYTQVSHLAATAYLRTCVDV